MPEMANATGLAPPVNITPALSTTKISPQLEVHLLSAVAEVLGLDLKHIQLADSFVQLGGDQRSAIQLRKALKGYGYLVRTRDVLRSQTLAELSGFLSPEFPPSIDSVLRSAPHIAAALSPDAAASRPNLLAEPSDPGILHSRGSSQTSLADRRTLEEVEEKLTSVSTVARVAIIRPKAGFLDEKLVAFLTLTTISGQENGSTSINLIPQSQMFYAGTQVAPLRDMLEKDPAVQSHAIPNVWIVVEGMPSRNGKIDRRKLQTWVQNVGPDLYQQIMSLDSQETIQAPSTDVERLMQRLVSKVLKVPLQQVGMNFSFAHLGGDGNSAMQLVASCRSEKIILSVADVMQSSTLAQLAYLAAQKEGSIHKWTEEPLVAFDLSPTQQLYFHTTWGGDNESRSLMDGSYRFNQSLLLRIRKTMKYEDVRSAVEAVVAHHSMLRSRFTRGEKGWMQKILPEVEGSYSFGNHSIRKDGELGDVIEKTQQTIDIESGPVFVVEYFVADDGQQMIFVIAHHLVVDLISWRVIIQDLDELLHHGNLLSLRSMPFQKWSAHQKQEIQRMKSLDLSLPFAIKSSDYTYWGMEHASNTYADAIDQGFSLTQELTALLQAACNQVFRTDTADIYLAALMLSFSQTFGDRDVPTVWNQEHGRESSSGSIDISETVGWFTTLCPIGVDSKDSDDFIDFLRRLKDARRAIPGRGWPYFASKFSTLKAPNLSARDMAFELVFSYAGSYQQLERENGVLEQLPIPGRGLSSKTSDIGPKVGRVALFEVSAMIDHGAAHIKFVWNRHSRHQDLIQAWIRNYEHLLLEAIGRLRYHGQELTKADVPYLDVTYEGLGRLSKDRLAQLNVSNLREIETAYPVTAHQQGILMSQAKMPDSCHIHTIYEFNLPRGSVDIDRLCSAWQQVTDKHAALRTVFIDSVTEGGLFDQVVLRKCSPNMLFIDSPAEQDPIVYLKTSTGDQKMVGQPGQPRHRLIVCQSPHKTYIGLDISEAICDSRSVPILFTDLKRFYTGEKDTGAIEFSYPNYLKHLQEAAVENDSIDIWRERLADIQPCHFPRLTVKADTRQFQSHRVDIDIASDEITAFAQWRRVSVDTVLHVAWALVLRAFTGSSRVSFGYRVSGRDLPDTLGMDQAVGCFVNTIVCSLHLWANKPLTSALLAAEGLHKASLPHQHVSVAEVQHALGLGSAFVNGGGDLLFNTCLSLYTELGGSGLKSRFSLQKESDLACVFAQETAEYDLSISARLSTGNSPVAVDVGHRILSPEQALNVANTFSRAMRAILSSPDAVIGTVDLFSDHDYAQIVAWGNTAAASDLHARRGGGNDEEKFLSDTEKKASRSVVQDMVTRHEMRTPDAPAICAWDGDLTYREMEEYATRLAHHLINTGVGPLTCVPIVMEKSRWAVVAMLAVLKIGASFVPVDADEMAFVKPIARLSNARTAIVSEASGKHLPGGLFEKLLVITDSFMLDLQMLPHTLPPIATPIDTACMLFTPVSSREVRGLCFTHQALLTAMLPQGPAMGINGSSRVLQLSSFSVDIAMAEIFTTLIHGGCVCMPSSEERTSNFTAAVQRMKVNWTYMTPVLSRKLNPLLLESLQTVCFRTRSLDEDTYNPWKHHDSKVKVLMAYGAPDVCPLGISVMEVKGHYDLNRIGRPFVGSFWIVNPDDNNRPMPVGAIGELMIEGPMLGCNLQSEHDLILSPRAGSGGKRVRYFKTGHRVRYTEGGAMEFISNRKEDVEINGKIVVLSEVEKHIRRCLGPGTDVMIEVIAFKGSKSIPVLAAFIELGANLFVGEQDLSSLSSQTRERIYVAKKIIQTSMRNSVASYMIPSIFIPVRHLPVTPSLKVNRRKLQKLIHGMSREALHALSIVPNPEEVQSIGLKPLPLTQIEERMRCLWANVLGVSENTISAADGFLRAGGDDVLAARLVIAGRKEGIDISIAEVLNNATLTDLCRTLASSVEEPQSAVEEPMPTLDPAAQPPATPLTAVVIENVLAPKAGVDKTAIKDVAEASAMQTRFIESAMLRGRANINYFVFNFDKAVIDSKQLEEACQTLGIIHPILRTAFVPYDRKVYQIVLKSHDLEFKTHHCPAFRLAGMAEKLVKKDQQGPIAFCEPITKFMFIEAGKQSALIMRFSRAQYDDLSVKLLVKDLKKLYDGCDNPPRRPAYCEYIRAANEAAENGAEDYWSGLLKGAEMTTLVKHIKPHHLTSSVKTIRNKISVGSLSNLGISFETVLKAAWAMVLATLAGHNDVVFGELVEGRHVRLPNGQSVSQIMGPCENAIPVRVSFPEENMTPLALLQSIHAQRIAGIPYENLGFLDIVEKCTQWPYWTRFSSLVHHRYHDTLENSDMKFDLGKASCKFTITESKARDPYDIYIRTYSPSTGEVDLDITYAEDRLPAPFAEETLRLLSQTIAELTSVSVMQPLIPTAGYYRGLVKQIPVLMQAPPPHPDPSALTQLLPQEACLAIQNLISAAWATILDPRTLGVPEGHIITASFYDLWGSLIPAAQFASYFTKEVSKLGLSGLETAKFSMEDIVDHPNMLTQLELIIKKQRKGLKGPKSPEYPATAGMVSSSGHMNRAGSGRDTPAAASHTRTRSESAVVALKEERSRSRKEHVKEKDKETHHATRIEASPQLPTTPERSPHGMPRTPKTSNINKPEGTSRNPFFSALSSAKSPTATLGNKLRSPPSLFGRGLRRLASNIGRPSSPNKEESHSQAVAPTQAAPVPKQSLVRRAADTSPVRVLSPVVPLTPLTLEGLNVTVAVPNTDYSNLSIDLNLPMQGTNIEPIQEEEEAGGPSDRMGEIPIARQPTKAAARRMRPREDSDGTLKAKASVRRREDASSSMESMTTGSSNFENSDTDVGSDDEHRARTTPKAGMSVLYNPTTPPPPLSQHPALSALSVSAPLPPASTHVSDFALPIQSQPPPQLEARGRTATLDSVSPRDLVSPMTSSPATPNLTSGAIMGNGGGGSSSRASGMVSPVTPATGFKLFPTVNPMELQRLPMLPRTISGHPAPGVPRRQASEAQTVSPVSPPL